MRKSKKRSGVMTKKPIILAGSKRFRETLENSRDVEKDIEILDFSKAAAESRSDLGKARR